MCRLRTKPWRGERAADESVAPSALIAVAFPQQLQRELAGDPASTACGRGYTMPPLRGSPFQPFVSRLQAHRRRYENQPRFAD